jgi:hypothetical protein
MDKLELDARVARLERRLSLLTAILAAAALAAGLFLLVAIRRVDETAAIETSVSPPVPPAPTAPAAFATGVFTPAPDVSMGALRDELIAVHALLDQGLISEDEWESKKARLLRGPVVASDLRSDLEQVRQLADRDLICEEERDALRARLLGLDEPTEAAVGH